ncbi:hypothetical protein K5D33_07335 [Pseudomonas cichorii]|nr:hypothetical protein [Pseudomonas cichorii]MBX8534536.1 hypothetical protein [Pseudomonas cichorii]
MELYDEMADAALEMITEFGRQITLKRTVLGDYDPAHGVAGGGVTETQIVTCVILPASKGTIEAFDDRFKSGTLIETNLRSLKIAAKGMVWPPAPGQTVEFDDHVWTLVGATPAAPGGVDIVYSTTVMR